jgi:hypothetical protein
MRSAIVIICGVAAVVACGPIDQSGGSPSVGPDGGSIGIDGGGIAIDGGTTGSGSGGTTPDAGGATGAGADGGTATGGTGGTGGSPAAAPCDGVLPAAVPAPQAVTVAHHSGDVCFYFTSDLGGNVAAESHPGSAGDNFNGAWQIWSPNGTALGGFSGVAGDIFGEETGFEATQHGSASSLVRLGPDGAVLRSTPLDNGGCASAAYASLVGGTLVVDNCGASVTLSRFDAEGNALVSIPLGAIPSAVGVTDAKGQTLVIFTPGSAVGISAAHAARWYDAQLAPSTGFFTAPGGSGNVSLQPLVGGGVALKIGGAWTGIVQSGATAFTAPPDWLAAQRNHDLQIVRGGRAYATLPRAGASPHNVVDLFAVTGESCGRLTVPAGGVSIGVDGTVIGAAGDGGCNMTWWSGLLK